MCSTAYSTRPLQCVFYKFTTVRKVSRKCDKKQRIRKFYIDIGYILYIFKQHIIILRDNSFQADLKYYSCTVRVSRNSLDGQRILDIIIHLYIMQRNVRITKSRRQKIKKNSY